MAPNPNRPLLYVTGVVVVCLKAVAVLITRDSGRPYVPGHNVRECRARYAAAKTAADSMRVDVEFMPTGTINSWTRHSGQCGELRYSGQLALHTDELPPPPRYTVDTARVLGKPSAR